MKNYIGVKQVEAKPMTLHDFDKMQNRVPGTTNADGYLVVYPDGYKSWSPKEVFKNSYFPITVPDKISEKDIIEFMGKVESQKIDSKTTLVSCQSKTGFTQHETSACVDPKNYDEELGKKYGIEKLKNKYWYCLGFVLQWAKNGLN